MRPRILFGFVLVVALLASGCRGCRNREVWSAQPTLSEVFYEYPV